MVAASDIPMDDLIDQVYALNPIPSVILDPSICVQRASNSFLQTTNLSSNEWQGSNYLELLRNRALVSDADARRIHDATEAAIRTHEVQVCQYDATAAE